MESSAKFSWTGHFPQSSVAFTFLPPPAGGQERKWDRENGEVDRKLNGKKEK